MLDKRLTTGELAVEVNRCAAVIGIHGPWIWGHYMLVLQRFHDLPHAGDNGYL